MHVIGQAPHKRNQEWRLAPNPSPSLADQGINAGPTDAPNIASSSIVWHLQTALHNVACSKLQHCEVV